MNPNDLARAVAAEQGAEVLAAVEAPPPDDKTRAFDITVAMAVAGFLVQCAQVAIQLYQARQDRALLVKALADSDHLMQAYPRLDPEKRLGLVARILAKMLPESFGRPAHDRSPASMADKQRWITEYVDARRLEAGIATRSWSDASTRDFVGGATILVPFADQFWWMLFRPVGWIPGPEDGASVVRVDVPRGFVTDLASVPSYLWTFLQKTGRHGNAAIYHDWLYWQQDCPRDVADRVFDRAMHDMGVDDWTRGLMWAGVRIFGGSYWDDNAREKAAGEKRVLMKFPDSPTITWEEWKQQPGVFG
jgi:hypothetical protein